MFSFSKILNRLSERHARFVLLPKWFADSLLLWHFNAPEGNFAVRKVPLIFLDKQNKIFGMKINGDYRYLCF
jgi:hypothetical protein